MDRLHRWVYVAVGIITILFAMSVQEQDLIVTKTEGNAIADPATRLLAQVEWVRLFLARYGHLIGNADDALLLLIAISVYVERISPILGQKFSRARRSVDRQPGVNRGILQGSTRLFASRSAGQNGRTERKQERGEHTNIPSANGTVNIRGDGGPGGIADSIFGQYNTDI